MKKGLVLGAMLVASVFLFTGAALASEISTSGVIEFKLTGTSQEDQASGLFAAGDVEVLYAVTLSSDSWEANLTPKFDLAGEALAVEDAYIKYAADMMSVTMKPLGADKELFDVEGAIGDPPNIPSNAGLVFEIPLASLTADLVVNNQAVGDEATFSYAFGAAYEMDPITMEAMYGGTDVAAATWYGSYYGAAVTYAADPLTVVGQYGSFSPEAAGLEDGSGFFASLAYAMGEGLGTLTLKYTSVDENMNGAGVPTDEEYSKIYGEYSHPLTDAVSLKLDVSNITDGSGADSYSEYEAVISVGL